jgi:hypothetical protein
VRAAPLLALVVVAACGPDYTARCRAWATAPCPAEFPNISQPVTEDACVSNARFACGAANCDAEYDAKITCETENPTCCDDVECDDAPSEACGDARTAWEDCTSRVRDACEAGA